MPSSHNYFVYILECSDSKYYTGVTNDLDARVVQHNEGHHPTAFTYGRRPVVLRYYQRFSDINYAISWEKQLKGWSRKKKEALFNEDWSKIQELSRNHSSRRS
jgi:putative endonuclease